MQRKSSSRIEVNLHARSPDEEVDVLSTFSSAQSAPFLFLGLETKRLQFTFFTFPSVALAHAQFWIRKSFFHQFQEVFISDRSLVVRLSNILSFQLPAQLMLYLGPDFAFKETFVVTLS